MKLSILKPTIEVKAKNPKMAVYAHLLSLIAGILLIVLGVVALIRGGILGGILSLIVGVVVLLVEIDVIEIGFLKDALVRGILWIILAIVVAGGSLFDLIVLASWLCLLVGGILDLIYHFK